MCNCGVNTRSFFGGLATLICITIVGCSAGPPGAANSNVDGKQNSILVAVTPSPPARPQTTDCFNYFPGTPGWNECFRKFSQDMASYQAKVNEYNRATGQQDNGFVGSYSTMNIPGQYSESHFSSDARSTSNSYTGGYAIQAVNMALSTSQNNNVVKVNLYAGHIDSFETKTNGNEITINVVSQGQRKWAKITVPNGVKVTDVKVERSVDSIYVTGPTSVNDGGNFHISQSGSSGFNSASFSNNYGSVPMPPMGMPDMQNMFQNMFQNIFSNMFGDRSYQAQAARSYGYPSYFSPHMWFY